MFTSVAFYTNKNLKKMLVNLQNSWEFKWFRDSSGADSSVKQSRRCAGGGGKTNFQQRGAAAAALLEQLGTRRAETRPRASVRKCATRSVCTPPAEGGGGLGGPAEIHCSSPHHHVTWLLMWLQTGRDCCVIWGKKQHVESWLNNVFFFFGLN